MKRRDFVTAGFAFLGAVGLSTSSAASPRVADSTPVAGGRRQWRQAESTQPWDGQVRAEAGGSQQSDEARLALAGELTALLSPLRGGSDVAGSTLREAYVDQHGTGAVVMEDPNGRFFRLDVCRRQGDPGVTPLAVTAGYEVYVRNGASGARATERDTILAGRRLAEIIAGNEGGAQLALVSKREYWG